MGGPGLSNGVLVTKVVNPITARVPFSLLGWYVGCISVPFRIDRNIYFMYF